MTSLTGDVLSDLKKQIDGTFASLKQDLAKFRTGRASIAMLDGVRVNYYGTPTPLNQCSNLSVPDPRLIIVKPWDKSIIGDVEKALRAADLGVNPQNDGDIIRLPIPALNEERRKELVKQAKHRGEEAKISVRNHRRDANEMLKELEKDKEISQDELKTTLEKVQKEIDRAIKQVDDVIAAKEKEVLEV
jgi:ribosome recycling factor